jgi:hypothetical protein
VTSARQTTTDRNAAQIAAQQLRSRATDVCDAVSCSR